MKKTIIFFIVLLSGLPLFAQTHLYENPSFAKIAKSHHIIGIIPFKASVTLRPKQMADITAEQLERMEKTEGEAIQSALFSWFLKRKEKGKLIVEVQDIATTNALLDKAGITIKNYKSHTPKELAKIIGTDAIIMGSFKTNKPMSEGASIALGVLVGFYGATNHAVLNLFIYNAKDGRVLVNYNKGVSGSLGSSTDMLINRLMRKASRRIAYVQ